MDEEAKEKAKKKAEKAARKAEKEAKKARKEAKQLAKLKGEDGDDSKEKGDGAEDEDVVMYGAPDDHAWTDTSAALKDADKKKKDDGPDLSVSVYMTLTKFSSVFCVI